MMQTAALLDHIHAADWIRRRGHITRVVGLTVASHGPDARLGEICSVSCGETGGHTLAEVVGFSDGQVLLMPYEDLAGIKIGCEVTATGETAQIRAGDHLLGRVVDAFGEPLDGLPFTRAGACCPIYPTPINPLRRGMVTEVLETGVRAIDALLTIGRGQRVGIFAGSGVGKSTVLGMIARQVRADVSVIALVGERGREVKTFVETGLSSEARRKSVVIAATSDQPALVRRRAAFVATAVAEYFADQGLNVCLTMDSVTRVAMAQREIGLASGELPTARGYTPSVFALLPKLLERGGVRAAGGSLTALYTILVEGDDLADPIADTVRSILDGHIVLSRAVAQRGRYPAVDVTQSVSRLTSALVADSDHRLIVDAVKALAIYESSRDLIEVGAYRAGTNAAVDRAIKLVPQIEDFMAQRPDQVERRGAAVERLRAIVESAGRAA